MENKEEKKYRSVAAHVRLREWEINKTPKNKSKPNCPTPIFNQKVNQCVIIQLIKSWFSIQNIPQETTKYHKLIAFEYPIIHCLSRLIALKSQENRRKIQIQKFHFRHRLTTGSRPFPIDCHEILRLLETETKNIIWNSSSRFTGTKPTEEIKREKTKRKNPREVRKENILYMYMSREREREMNYRWQEAGRGHCRFEER